MLARHELVWLRPEGWRRLRSAASGVQALAIDRWHSEDWPATVRRHDADAAPDEVCLGITLPCDSAGGARTRVALRCRQSDIRRAARPLALGAADAVIAPHWAPAWQALRRSVADARLDIRVFGSLAMQALTGQPYLTEKSDIDLLFSPASLAQLRAGTALFAAGLDLLPLDGEVLFPSGRALAWKEWCNASMQDSRGRVLVKQMDKVSLCTAAELLGEFGETACAH
ncbi:MAG: malonate decarboxylase holo-[acyl-carrier-protein] synthase [Noviherbaspirillum sp.]